MFVSHRKNVVADPHSSNWDFFAHVTFTLFLLVSSAVIITIMNSSNNPFLPPYYDLNDSFVLNQVPAATVTKLPSFVHSTPMYTVSKSTDKIQIPTVVVQPPPILPDKQTIQPFSGFMHEDAEKFLSEFESYLTLASIDIYSPRAVAAFHLFLKGPALIWFNSLTCKQSWETVKASFQIEYCNILKSPSLIAESLAFDNLRLSQSQPIEDFHALIMDKGRKLRKSEADMTNKFISGLPAQLAFFVRAGRVESLRDALQSAKIGEAHGYRQYNLTTSTISHASAAAGSVQQQLDEITKRLDELSRTSSHPEGHVQPTKGPVTSRVCYRCKGEKHIKTKCNWDGQGEPSPSTKCQLCFQMGHGAPHCKKLNSHTETVETTCQICNQPDHTAVRCPQLNRKGLGTERTSQA